VLLFFTFLKNNIVFLINKIDLKNIKVSLFNIKKEMDKDDEPIYSSDEEDSVSENESSEEETVIEQDDDNVVEEDEISVNDEPEENDDDEDSENDDLNDENNIVSNKKTNSIIGGTVEYGDDDEDEDEQYMSPYLQKFNAEINKNYILDFHPECSINNYDEISLLTQVVRDKSNNIIDDLHKTIPFLTKYERTRVIGQRAKQISSGAKTFVKVPENVIDGYLIAELELMQKRIPFIIRRPTPGGGCEYWNLKDLEIVSF
jgi:DNA-directed RNA polymerases I, II, and III subunit RPABC2